MRRRGDQGAATVIAVAMLGVLLATALAVMSGVALVAGHRRAQVAADLAALAGAAALQDGGDGCERADTLARRNGARLTGCQVLGWTLSVSTVYALRLPAVGVVSLPARSRAGPASTLHQARGP